MSDTKDQYSGFGYLILIVFSLLIVMAYIFDEPFTIAWAAFRYAESYIWTSIPLMPKFISDTHYDLRTYLDNTNWIDLNWSNVFLSERILSYTSTWVYLLPATKYYWGNVRKNRIKDSLNKRITFEDMLLIQSNVYRYTRYLIKNNPLKDSLNLNVGKFAIRASMLHGLKKMRILWPDRQSGELIFDEARAVEVFSNQLRYLIPRDINELSLQHKFYICLFSLRLGDLPNVYNKNEIKSAKRYLSFIKLALYFLDTPLLNKLPILKTFINNLKESRIFYGYGDFSKERYLNEDSFNETFRLSFIGDMSFHYNGELSIKYIERHVDHIFPQVIANKTFNELLSQHAYVETLLRRLLHEGRAIGKMPPNHFSYLKMVDRGLWYALNDEGLPGASIEAIGVYSHYELEYKSGLKSYFPNVHQGIISLNYPKTIAEFDRIKVNDDHPLSELFDYDPNLEYQEHLIKLKNDPDYRLKQTILREQNN